MNNAAGAARAKGARILAAAAGEVTMGLEATTSLVNCGDSKVSRTGGWSKESSAPAKRSTRLAASQGRRSTK